MRFETHNASQHLVHQLLRAQAVHNIRDDGDILLLDLQDRKQVMILLVERGISLSEVQYHYQTNTRQGIYTLMLLWADMFIPRDGSTADLSDWMQVLDALHGGKLYGYEVAGRHAFFFPVELQGEGVERRVHFDTTIDFSAIGGRSQYIDSPHMMGEWLVAGFDFKSAGYRQTKTNRDNPLSQYYLLLGLDAEASFAEVKQAYRALARLYHPDMSDAVDADERMKRINAAYQAITRHHSQ